MDCLKSDKECAYSLKNVSLVLHRPPPHLRYEVKPAIFFSSYVGIHCEVIDGYSKGAGYKPNNQLDSDTFRNQWTCVYVGGAWRFVNCNWGARHVKGPRDNSLTYKCDEFYFLTDPEDHIYQHFPDESSWQLLEESITLQDFINLPVVKSPFFNCGLKFIHPYEAVLFAPDGMLDVVIQQPRLLPFAAKLKSKSKGISSEMLVERTLIRAIANEISVTINLPCTGVYYLDLFVASSFDSPIMDNACCFQIRCAGTSKDAHVSYPQVGCFGRTLAMDKLGIVEESNKDPYLRCKGEKHVKFSMSKDLKMSHTLAHWDYRDRKLIDMDRYAFLRVRKESSAEFVVRCPRKGLYVFTLFANDAKDNEYDMKCIYRYLIDCRQSHFDCYQMPKYSKRWKNAKLHEPMNYCLERGTDVIFRLEVKRASEIVVQEGNNWHNLYHDGKAALWHGTIYTGNRRGKLMVYARYESNAEKFVPLMEYKVIDRRSS